jgi:hypothetical protein
LIRDLYKNSRLHKLTPIKGILRQFPVYQLKSLQNRHSQKCFPIYFQGGETLAYFRGKHWGLLGYFVSPTSYNEFPHISAALPHFQGLRALFKTSKITSPRDPAGIGIGGEETLIYKGWGGVLKLSGETLVRVSPILYVFVFIFYRLLYILCQWHIPLLHHTEY